jgi:DNA-binding MarR family transcriptional regulator
VIQPTTELEQLSAELVVYAGRLVRAVSRRVAYDAPAATLRLLSQVEELGPVTVGDLARADRCSQPTMTNAVHNLTAKGWARKDPNPHDARSSFVTISDDGRQVLATSRRRYAAVIAERLRATPEHGPADVAAAVALLRHLLEQSPEQFTPDHQESLA